MAMALPTNFQFSQASLQNFVDCRRRFYYRYVERLSWPALESEPALENERYMQQGAAFHQLVHQHILGIPPDRLLTVAESEGLANWWTSFMNHVPFDKGDQLLPERMLTTMISEIRLLAKFDLVAIKEDGSFTIYDWKTSRKRPTRERMVTRIQSRVYPYVLAKAGKSINLSQGVSPDQGISPGQDISPDRIEMVYWYPNYPDNPEVIQYSETKFREDDVYLNELIHEIVNLEGIDQFRLTPHTSYCRYCVYRSLCDRGESAGDLKQMEDLIEVEDFDLDIDFDQIAEIEF
jgi:hypothetical protein